MSERHTRLSGNLLVVATIVADCFHSICPPIAARVCNLYPRWLCREQRVSRLKDYLHVRSDSMSPRNQKDLDAGG